MIKIHSAKRLITSETWFDSLSEFQKKEYLKEHPNSKYAKKWQSTPEQVADDIGEYWQDKDAEEVETLGSKIRSLLVKALGGEPNRVFKTKNGLLKSAFFSDAQGNDREVHMKYTPAMLKSGKKFSPYGYWKDKDTYVYMTRKEWKGLSKEQRRNIEDRQKAYAIDTNYETGESAKAIPRGR
jgi:hypothetical protein